MSLFTLIVLAYPANCIFLHDAAPFVVQNQLGLPLTINGPSPGAVNCRRTDNSPPKGPSLVYESHAFTSNQVNAAFMKGASLAADGKQLGPS
jgi:hypothetical protein